jgi:hypothetical protein
VWSTPRPGRFTPGKDPVPIVQEAGWAPVPVWTGAENLTPTGIRSPDRSARSESLYRLSYPGPSYNTVAAEISYAFSSSPSCNEKERATKHLNVLSLCTEYSLTPTLSLSHSPPRSLSLSRQMVDVGRSLIKGSIPYSLVGAEKNHGKPQSQLRVFCPRLYPRSPENETGVM